MKYFLIFTLFLFLSGNLIAIAPPSLVEPQDGMLLSESSVAFVWNSQDSAISYDLRIATDSAFSNIITNPSNLTSPQWDTTGLPHQHYYWQIRSYDGTAFSNWSNAWEFTVFSPADIAGNKFWYLPDSGVVLSNGQVSQWSDQSGNGNHLFQSEAQKQPVFTNNIESLNGRSSLTLDGNDDYLQSNAFNSPLSQGNMIFFVGDLTQSPSGVGQWMDGISSNNRQIFQNTNLTESRIFAGSVLNYTGATDFPSPHYFTLSFNGTDSKIIVNGKDSLTGNAGTASLGGLTLGSKFNEDNFFPGNITEVIGYSNLLSDSLRNLVEKYFQYKYSPPVNLGPDLKVCDTTTELFLEGYYKSTTWSTGATTDTLAVDSAGKYWVEAVGVFNDTTYDTIEVSHINTPIPEYNLPASSNICIRDTLNWNTQLDHTGYNFQWQDGTTDSLYSITDTGKYYVTISDTFGCSKTSDTLDVLVSYFPDSASLGPDTSLCKGNPISLQTGGPAATIYQWSTGETTPNKNIDTSGTYSLTTYDTLGCRADDTIDITVIGDAPDVYFEVSTPCQGTNVSFFDSTTVPGNDSITSWTWDFGDGDSASVKNPIHLFPDTGNYEVNLKTTLNTSCAGSYTDTIRIHPRPTANFTHNTPCKGDSVFFNDFSSSPEANLTNWSWNFGEPSSGSNNISSLPNPAHLYSSAGIYTSRVIVTDANGCKDTLARTVNVLARPTADFIAPNVCKGTPAQFDDNSIGNITGRSWDLGDGTAVSSQEQFAHLYDSSKTYYPSLQVTAQNGCTHDTIDTLTIYPLPQPGFDHGSICNGVPVKFNDTSSIDGGSLKDYYWEASDGKTSFQRNPKFTFTDTGTYGVYLRIASDQGCIGELNTEVQAYPVPTVDFSIDTNFGKPPYEPNITNLSNATDYLWDFGNGSSSTATTPNPIYTDSGIYTIQLIGTSSFGCQDSSSKKIYAMDPIIDVMVQELYVQESNGFLEVSADLVNFGPIELQNLVLNLGYQGGPAYQETWTGKVQPGGQFNYIFQGQFEKTERKDYICLTAISPNGLEDDDPSNNTICHAFSNAPRILSLYPNPVVDQLTLDFTLPRSEEVSIEIYNRIGKLVLDQQVTNTSKGLNTLTFDSNQFSKGLYTLKLTFAGEVMTETFLKADED